MIKKIIFTVILLIVALVAYLYLTNGPTIPESQMQYGVSFSIIRATDLGLSWKPVFDAILNDLNVKRLRLAAFWPLIEAKKGVYDFTDMDYQMNQAASHNAKVVLAIGRRLPGWPECHDPDWLAALSPSDQDTALEQMITAVVNRYKNSPALDVWQVENEPFFSVFTSSRDLCQGATAAEVLKEVQLVHQLDPNHQIMLTDGGELGTWYQAYKAGDQFGTSQYLYVWNSVLGYIHYPIGAWYFRIKIGLMRLLYGTKPTTVIELQSEPWMPQPLDQVPIAEQLTHFNIDRMNELIAEPYQSGFTSAYLWGAEWWYWMEQNGHPEFWDRAKELYAQ